MIGNDGKGGLGLGGSWGEEVLLVVRQRLVFGCQVKFGRQTQETGLELLGVLFSILVQSISQRFKLVLQR